MMVQLPVNNLKKENRMNLSIETIRGAVARGWCSKENEKKEWDSVLAEAISKEVMEEIARNGN